MFKIVLDGDDGLRDGPPAPFVGESFDTFKDIFLVFSSSRGDRALFVEEKLNGVAGLLASDADFHICTEVDAHHSIWICLNHFSSFVLDYKS